MKKGSTVLIALVLTLGALSDAYAANYSFTTVDYPGGSPVYAGAPNSATSANAINNGGTIVGTYADASGYNHGFSLSGGTYTSFSYPGAQYTWANGINSGGTIVGEYWNGHGSSVDNGFSLSGTTYTSLNYPGHPSEAIHINDGGVIVGDYWDTYSEDSPPHGFSLSGTTYTPVNYPGASSTQAYGINTGGTIVGEYYDASGALHGFSLSGTTYTPLNYPGASATAAAAINKGGTIVGHYKDASGASHGFSLSGTTYTPLNYPGASSTFAYDINDGGTIVGQYYDANGVEHGFLAIPTPALSIGWNLVSLPVQPANTSIASVLSGVKGAYEVVWAYPNQTWQVYDPNDAAGSTLTTMQAGMGYWIKMTSAKTLDLSGTAPSSSLTLTSGWNLVGYNGTSCAPASTALFSLGSALQVSWGYPSQGWQFYDPTNLSSTLSQFCPGAGYWLNVGQGVTWSGW